MSDFDFEDEQADESGPSALRAALKAQQKANKELTEKLAALEAAQRTGNIKSILSEKGLRPTLAKYIPSDVTDADGVAAWLKENAEDFGINLNAGKQTEAAEKTEDVPSDDEGKSNVPAGFEQLWARMNQQESAGESALSPDRAAATLEAMKNAGSFDAAAAILAKGGV